MIGRSNSQHTWGEEGGGVFYIWGIDGKSVFLWERNNGRTHWSLIVLYLLLCDLASNHLTPPPYKSHLPCTRQYTAFLAPPTPPGSVHFNPYTRVSSLICRPAGSNFKVWGGGGSFSVFRKSNMHPPLRFISDTTIQNPKPNRGGGGGGGNSPFQTTVKFKNKIGRPGHPSPSNGPAMIQKTTGADIATPLPTVIRILQYICPFQSVTLHDNVLFFLPPPTTPGSVPFN